MARIPLLPDPPADPQALALFERVRGYMGPDFHMPALYRVLGHAPALFEAWLDFAWPLRLKAKTPRKLRELMILRGAQVAGTGYEWAHHVPMALSAGVSDAQIDALAHWKESEHFSAQEMGSGTSFGHFLDGRLHGAIQSPWPLVSCPGNGFVIYKDDYSADEIKP